VKDLALNVNICKQYKIGVNKITRPMQTLLQASLEDVLNLFHNDKKQWLASVKAARNRYKWASAQSITAQCALLHNWLHPQQPERLTSHQHPTLGHPR